MIQSMEILQLPILALQERIEQEMEENPVLELQEEDPDLPGRANRAEHEVARRAHRGRARAGHRRDQGQRGRLRAAAEDGRGVARPLRGAHAALAQPRSRRRASASTTPWPTWPPGPSRCKTTCTTSSAGSTWSRSFGRWPTGSSTTSTPTATCRASLEDLLGPDADRGGSGAGPSRPWRWCRSSTRRASAPAICASACCCNSRPACPTTSSCRR